MTTKSISEVLLSHRVESDAKEVIQSMLNVDPNIDLGKALDMLWNDPETIGYKCLVIEAAKKIAARMIGVQA